MSVRPSAPTERELRRSPWSRGALIGLIACVALVGIGTSSAFATVPPDVTVPAPDPNVVVDSTVPTAPPTPSAPPVSVAPAAQSPVTIVGTSGTTPVAVQVPPLGAAGVDGVDEAEIVGPEISVGSAEAAPGDRVTVGLDGFGSLWATVTVCGNEARRGSQDCNQSSSVTKEFGADGSPVSIIYVVTAPPMPCPCVVRAVGRDTREVAVAPLSIVGHPVAPVVDPPVVGDLVELSIVAEPWADGALGALRAELGGPATYEVTVSIHNISTAALSDVSVVGSVRRGTDSLGELRFDDPGALGVGQTWRQTVRTTVPAPSFGEVEWQVTASGAGPSVDADLTTSHRPWLLIALALVVAMNIGVLLVRWRVRRRREHVEHGEIVDVVDATSVRSSATASASRERSDREPVGADR